MKSVDAGLGITMRSKSENASRSPHECAAGELSWRTDESPREDPRAALIPAAASQMRLDAAERAAWARATTAARAAAGGGGVVAHVSHAELEELRAPLAHEVYVVDVGAAAEDRGHGDCGDVDRGGRACAVVEE